MRVQPQFPAHLAHQARQPSLPARAAGPVHLDKFHRDQRRPGGPAAGRCGQHGEARLGGAEGEEGPQLFNSRETFCHVSVGKSEPEQA